MNIADLRQEYMRAGLSEADAHADPFAQFERWFKDALAAQLPLANAMTLATVTPEGGPDARVLLLKGVEGGSFVFYTNYESRKGRELAQNPHAALTFLWKELERQVRIEGRVEKVAADESRAYYETRPLGARIGAWASPQSEVIENRAWLEKRWAELSTQHGEAPPLPPHWGGYRVMPEALEFWQGRRSRLHDRITYRRDGNGWKLARLAP